jgi:hypothetical protein
MEKTAKNFKSSYGDDLVITGSDIKVTNKFGHTYKGRLENDKVVTATQIGLSYLMRAYNEFKLELSGL